MSMTVCDFCDRYIDTDNDPDAIQAVDQDDQGYPVFATVCDVCRDKDSQE